MDLREALANGKPFKRKGTPILFLYNGRLVDYEKAKNGEIDFYILNEKDILATDWEIAENDILNVVDEFEAKEFLDNNGDGTVRYSGITSETKVNGYRLSRIMTDFAEYIVKYKFKIKNKKWTLKGD